MAKIAIVCTLLAASGFLPIDFTAEEPIQPIEIAGKTVPAAIEATVAHNRIESISAIEIIIFYFSKIGQGPKCLKIKNNF
jgi:ABC-type uncharacterized transport system YnjBCD permease subunit